MRSVKHEFLPRRSAAWSFARTTAWSFARSRTWASAWLTTWLTTWSSQNQHALHEVIKTKEFSCFWELKKFFDEKNGGQ